MIVRRHNWIRRLLRLPERVYVSLQVDTHSYIEAFRIDGGKWTITQRPCGMGDREVVASIERYTESLQASTESVSRIAKNMDALRARHRR